MSDEILFADSQQQILRVFQQAAGSVPAYRQFLDRQGVSAAEITSFDRFRARVPLLDKPSWFAHELRDLCRDGNFNDAAAFYSSSGYTGVFSFAIETHQEQQRTAELLDIAFERAFKALSSRTLLINCLPMGVRVHTRDLPVADTSVREDIVWALLRKLRGEYEQFVVIGEHLFLKFLVEEGLNQSLPIPWKSLRIHLITGAEYVAENFRSYLCDLLGMDVADPSSGSFVINYGLSELSSSIAQENWHTIQIRRLAHRDLKFRDALCGLGPFCPTVMQYHPSHAYLETYLSPSGCEELVVTMLDPDRCIPMIRYNTGDRARLMSHRDLAARLRDFGHEHLIPHLPLPILLLWGKCSGVHANGGTIYPEQIKDALYADPRIAASVTGTFRLGKGTPSSPEVLLQLKQGLECSAVLREGLDGELAKCVATPIAVIPVPYGDPLFCKGHDFERKTRYVSNTP